MVTLDTVKHILKEHKSVLFNKYPLKSMAIFGSISRGEETETSDVDILVEFNGKIGIRFIDLADEIEEYLKTKVDLVSKNGMKEKYFRSVENDLVYV